MIESLFYLQSPEEVAAELLVAILFSALLFHFRPEERKSLINTARFFLVCLLGQFVSNFIYQLALPRAASILHEFFLIGTGIAVIRLGGQVLFRLLLPTFKLPLPRITEDIAVIVAYIAWIMVRLRYAGLDLGSILATSAMLTAVVAFAMQDTLGNILGGLALQLDNSIDVGDWVKVDEVSGRVVDIRWRSTLVETRNWETVVIPNSMLMKGKFQLLGRRADQPSEWRRTVGFNVSLDTPPNVVTQVVEEALHDTDLRYVAKRPQPNCVLLDLNPRGYAHYGVRYWLTNLYEDDPTDALIRWHVMTALQRAGIKLAVEEGALRITKENDKHEEARHVREIQHRKTTLRQVELFANLSDEELYVLAEKLQDAPFSKGNLIAKQGAVAHWLYIIISGEAEVYLELADGSRRTISRLMPGSFFGEMGLMTGAPRAASVEALTDMECYRLNKDGLEELLQGRPSIAEEMSKILLERQAELDRIMQTIDTSVVPKPMSPQHNELLSSIKRYFGLRS